MRLRMTTALVALAMLGAPLAMAGAARATPAGSLGPAGSGFRYQLSVGDGLPPAFLEFGSGVGPGAFNRNASDPGSSSSGLISAYINYGSNPTLSAFVTAQGSGISSITLTMNYGFSVTAADQAAFDDLAAYLALDPAHGMTLTGNYAASISGSGSLDSGAFALIDAGFGEMVFRCTPGGDACTNGIATPYVTTGAVTADPGTLSFAGTIMLGVTSRVLVNEFVGTNQSAYAMIDPIVSLPQGFLGNPGSYVVNYSPNLTGGTVPEPASWAMLVMGFALVGGWQRRGRRGRVVAA